MKSVQLSFQTGTFTYTLMLKLFLSCLTLALILPHTFYLSHNPILTNTLCRCLFSLLHSPLSPHSSLLLSPLTPTTFPYIVTNLQDSYLSYKQILILDTETEWHSSECVQVRIKDYTNIIYSIIFM